MVNESPQSRQRIVHIRSVRKMMKKSDTYSVLIRVCVRLPNFLCHRSVLCEYMWEEKTFLDEKGKM